VRFGILAQFIAPSVLVTAVATIALALADHLALAAYAACCFAFSCVVLRWAMPKSKE
jgi:hypothetical protein